MEKWLQLKIQLMLDDLANTFTYMVSINYDNKTKKYYFTLLGSNKCLQTLTNSSSMVAHAIRINII